MMENDLCEKLAIQICDISNGKEWDATLAEEHKERHREVVREEILPLVHSYANALVAAAGEACAKHVPIIEQGIHVRLKVPANWLACSCGQLIVTGEKKFDELWADHLRSAVTPESAAKELERIKIAARHEGQKQEISAQMVHIKDYPNLGDCEWHCTTVEPLIALLDKIDIERIKNEARTEILNDAKQAINGCLELGYGNEKSKISRYDAIDAIAALEAAKEK